MQLDLYIIRDGTFKSEYNRRTFSVQDSFIDKANKIRRFSRSRCEVLTSTVRLVQENYAFVKLALTIANEAAM